MNPPSSVYATVAPWPGQDDGDEGRKRRGFAIAALVKIKRSEIGFIVPSQSGRGKYTVIVEGAGFCSCPDYEARRRDCKHIYAVRYMLQREDGGAGDPSDSLDVSTLRVSRKTYPQDWPAYNKAKTCEIPTFHRMLHNLCSGIPQPPQGRGRPRMPLSDMAFSVTSKVYRGFSSRRFDGDMADALDKRWIHRKPHFNTVCKYMASPALTLVLHDLIAISALPLVGVESHFSIDSTGFSTSRTVHWHKKKHEKASDFKEWVKVHFVCGTNTKVVAAVTVSDWKTHDNNFFKPLLRETADRFNMTHISADKAYLDRNNMELATSLGAMPLIPFKTNTVVPPDDGSAWTRMYHFYSLHRQEFLDLYHQRSNVETGVGMVKNNHREVLLSKSDVGQENEVLCKFLCQNLCVLIKAMYVLGIDEPLFDAI